MAAFAGMLNYSLLIALHFLAVVPLHTARSLWIATKLKLHPDVVSELSCYDAVDLKKVVKNMEEPVVADRSCGHCGSIQGTFEQGATACIFGRNGPRSATMFNFVCNDCGTCSGPSTVSLRIVPGEKPCHLVHLKISEAAVFVLLPKPHQRHDEITGYERTLLEEMTDDAATIKTFEGFVNRYNRTTAFGSKLSGDPPPRLLDKDTFRNAWFLWMAFEHGSALGVLPASTLAFTQAEMGSNGKFERYLESINGPMSNRFTEKYARHSEIACGVIHKALIGDGHCKTHYETCCNRSATYLRHHILGSMSLACDRSPLYFNRKKFSMCINCLKASTVRPDAGEKETSKPLDVEALEALTIDEVDRTLIGETWFDREDASTFMLKAVEWTLVDSVDGTQIPVLVGIHTDRMGDQHWSTMPEIRQWIKDSAITGPLSDRELRALRRDFRTKITDDGTDVSETSEVTSGTAPRPPALTPQVPGTWEK